MTTQNAINAPIPFSLANGGTGAALTASNGGILYSNASTAAILGGTATANQLLLSGASGAPAWSTVTHPATTTINQILYSSAANVISGLATANNGVLLTSGSGVPSIGTATVAVGGTGNTTFTAYSVICAGTTATGAFQNVSGVGSSGQVLTSNGASALPTWQGAGGIANLTYCRFYTASSASTNVTSANISSITYNSAGNVTLNFTSSFNSATSYTWAAMGTYDNTTSSPIILAQAPAASGTNPTSSALRVIGLISTVSGPAGATNLNSGMGIILTGT